MVKAGERFAVVAGAVCAALLVMACDEPAEPILVQRTQLTVHNQTRQDWHDIQVWVNDHYRVLVKSIEAGQRYRVPLDMFVAWQGQRFDPARQVVQGVEVTALTADGSDVVLVWGKGRRR
ncbi:MAG: hypothetical protein ACE148_04370 [Vicinamibacterales bacterium]